MSKLLFLQHHDASSTISTTFRGFSNRGCAQAEDFSYIIIKSFPFIYFGYVVYVPVWLCSSSLDGDGLCHKPLHHVYVSNGF